MESNGTSESTWFHLYTLKVTDLLWSLRSVSLCFPGNNIVHSFCYVSGKQKCPPEANMAMTTDTKSAPVTEPLSLEQRLCVPCDLGVVEDEFHFMFYCPCYHELRMSLFETIQNKNPDLFWMSEMLNWLFIKEVFVVANYIEKAWQLCWRTLYP